MTHFFKETIKVEKTLKLYDSVGTTHNQKKYVNSIRAPLISNYKLNITVPYTSTEKIVLLLESYTGNENNINYDIYSDLKKKFPNAQLVKSVIDDDAVPVYYLTSSKKTEFQFDHCTYINMWESSDEEYSIREYWSLWYHSVPFMFAKSTNANIINVQLSNLITNPANTIAELATNLNLSITNRQELQFFCRDWIRSQLDYFKILYNVRRIKRCLKNNINLDLSNITNLHDQGYINYCIEREFNVIIPVYDYRNWFKNTNEIKEMIEKLCLE
jgi:hypothetical protein